MKGGLVSMLYGAAAADQLGLLDGRRIVFHFVCDEETGSAAGSGRLREAGLIDPDAVAMLTAEPTGGVIWHACRGAITLRVRTSGREAHVGYVHQGVNAFEHMIRIAEPLTALSHELLEKRTSFPVESDEAAGSMLVVGGQAGSGAGFNAVPGSAWFSIDRRFNPEEELEEELDRLTGLIDEAADAAGATVDVEVLQQQPSGSTEQTHPAAQALARCIEAIEGAAPSFQLCPGCSTHAGTRSSASRPSPTAAGAWTSPTGPTSTSTRRRCAAAPPSTPCSPQSSNPRPPRPRARARRARRRGRVDAVGAHEGHHLAAGELLDAGDGVLTHGCLKLAPVVEDADLAARGREPALALGQRVFEENDHEVVADARPGARRPPAGVLRDQLPDGIGDGGGERATVLQTSIFGLGAHYRPLPRLPLGHTPRAGVGGRRRTAGARATAYRT